MIDGWRKLKLFRWVASPGIKAMGILLAALLVINALAIWGILSSRSNAESIAVRDLRLQTEAHARSLEAVLSSRRGDFIFLSQTPPLANAAASLKSQDPIPQRWMRLDIEGSLLLFMAAHPEVERLVIRDEGMRPLVAAGRREGAPVLYPSRDFQRPALPGEGYLLGSWPLRGNGKESGILETALHIPTLVRIAAPGMGPRFSLHEQDISGPLPAGEDSFVVSSAVTGEGWPNPVQWTLVCRERKGRLLESVTALAGRYRTTVILNLTVMSLALVLGFVGFQQVRRSMVLEAENRQQAKLRELERQLMHNERLASVGRLAAGMAHEINNPLEGMSNYLALLEDDVRSGRTEDALDLVGHVREGLDRASGITRQVLGFSDAGSVSFSPVDLNEVLRETVRFIRSRPAFRRAEVVLRTADVEVGVLGNRVTLGQLFLNLLMNACEVQPGGGRVEVTSDNEAERAVVVVADSGPGISPDVLSRIFEPFFSTRGSAGLGLYICHTIVSEHGGTIHARNRPEGGAVFRVELPLGSTALREI